MTVQNYYELHADLMMEPKGIRKSVVKKHNPYRVWTTLIRHDEYVGARWSADYYFCGKQGLVLRRIRIVRIKACY